MIYSTKTKLIILAIIAVILATAGYFYFSQKSASSPQPMGSLPIETEKKSLADDENYIKEKVDYFLANNPSGTSEEYARDIVFHDIAVKERDAKICEKVKDDYWKNHCHRLLK